MKTKPIKKILHALACLTIGLSAAKAGVLTYGFDGPTEHGEQILYTFGSGAPQPTANNIANATYSFDTTFFDEGTASFNMTGNITNQTFAYFRPTLAIGALAVGGGGTQDFSGANTDMSFRYAADANPDVPAVYARISFYKGGSPSDPSTGTLFLRSDYISPLDQSGNFATLSTTIVDSNRQLGSGYAFENGGTFADLEDVSFIQIVMGISVGTGQTSAFNFHLDALQISGPGISMIPEPTVSALLFFSLAGVFSLRRVRRSKCRP